MRTWISGRFSITNCAIALCFLGLATMAHAVQPTVKTVPWVASNPLIPHDAFSGVLHTLKGTADVQGANLEYTWDFGDGSPPIVGTVTNRYVIQATHSYIGSPGDIKVATLTVRDTSSGESDSENYFVAIRDMTLESEVNAAIDQGLWYLHSTMNRTSSGGLDKGDWLQGATCGVRCASTTWYAGTATNTNAFLANGHLESGASSNPYTETVQRAMRRVFELLKTAVVSNQTYPAPIGTVNPDTNGNGIGVEVAQSNSPYQGGQFMDAIVATGTPGAVAATGPAGIIGRSYKEIVQDMVDMYAYGQGNAGTYYGGWRYSWNFGSATHSDNSTNQWAAIGLIAAERGFGAIVPEFVKQSNENSVNRTQLTTGTEAGRFGYTNSTGPVWGPYATTPAGMVQMAMDGIGRADVRWDRTENFMRNRFCNVGGAGSAIKSYLYGLFSFTKGMLLHDSNGDAIAEPISQLSNQPGNLNSFDWYEAEVANNDPCDGVARHLVNLQADAGYWWGSSFSGQHFPFTTAWSVIMLNRTVFASGVPVAVARAIPNPAVVGQTVNLDGSASFHQDSEQNIISWAWDLDDDGLFDDAAGPMAADSYPALGEYPVGLQVCDDAEPQVCDDTKIIVRVTLPPLTPTANAGGPYSFCPAAKPWILDGRGSVNPDDGLSEPGLPGDSIQVYEWDLNNDGIFDDAIGAQPFVTEFFQNPGSFLVQLRVTDNTTTSFPSSGMSDLMDTDSAQLFVRAASDALCACIDDLRARPKSTKVQLTWGDTAPAGGYNVYRAKWSGGPYEFIANTTSTYSLYLDQNLANGSSYYYVVREVALNGNELCQSNEAVGTPLERRRRRGPALVVVPEVVGFAQAAAEAAIVTAGLAVGDVATANNPSIPFGEVISVNPVGGARVTGGSAVELLVSLGSEPVTVPALTGLDQGVAEDAIVVAGLTVGDVTTANHETVPVGNVISQNPASGALAAPGSPVDIVVSAGPALVVVPDVVGNSQAGAETAIADAGLVAIATTANHDTVPVGNVISQNPVGGTSVAPGSTVDIVVSSGPAPIAVPDVAGLAQAAAEAALRAGGFTPGASAEHHATVLAGNVISQDPVAGTLLLPGSTVNIVVSDGPPPIIVIDVVGNPQATAEAAIIDSGLGFLTTTANHDTVPAGDVISQNPVAGSSAAPGSTVNLVVSDGPAPIDIPDVTGLPQATAEADIVAANLIVGAVTTSNHETVPAGDVISQNPAACSACMAPGSAVDIVVSEGPAPIDVPDVTGLPQATAEANIVAANLIVGIVTTSTHETVPAGDVISQNPIACAACVAPGSAVGIVVSEGSAPVDVPDVTGLPQATAEANLVAANLIVGTVTTSTHASVPAGDVISQNPVACAACAAPGSAVNIVVSDGPPVAVPDVVGLTQVAAEAAITGAGLLSSATTVGHETVPAGDVISQDPVGGTSVISGSTVNVVVSDGPVPVAVPDVVGLPQAAAEAAITSASLTVGTVGTANSDTVPAGDVISQNPVSGASVAPGTAVAIVVSDGPVPVLVPDLVGLPQAAAEAAITGAGLAVGSVSTANSVTVPAGDVISQNPASGASVAPGTSVAIVVSDGPTPVVVPGVVGLPQAAAESAITGAGLVVGAVSTASSDTVPAGDVISQDPAGGGSAAPGSAVALVISDGAAPDSENPILTAVLDVTPPFYDPGQNVLAFITASDNSGTVDVTFTLDGGVPQAATLPVTMIDTTAMAAASSHEMIVTAMDPAANSVSITLNFTIRDPNDTTAPIVAITSPAAESEVIFIADLIGTASDPTLSDYEVSAALVGDTEFFTLFTGNTSVDNDVLGQINATSMENGMYRVRLTAFDANGNGAQIEQIMRISGVAKVGNLRLTFTDLQIPVAGIPIVMSRTYDSRYRTKRAFGYNWSLDIARGSVHHNRVPGEGWRVVSGGLFNAIPCVSSIEDLSHVTEVRLSDQEFYLFRPKLNITGGFIGACEGFVSYDFVDGSRPAAQLAIIGDTSFIYQTGFGQILTPSFTQFNPQDFRLTTVDGRKFDVNVQEGIKKLEDQNGNQLTISSGGVVHSSGKAIVIDRDLEGRIVQITDPESEFIQYQYDVAGDLVKVIDREKNERLFFYDNHLLTEIRNGRGETMLLSEFDASGLLVATIDGDGKRVEYGHDLDNKTELVTNQDGTSSIIEYDINGNITLQTDETGVTTTHTYDADNNLISTTEPGSITTTYEYVGGFLSATNNPRQGRTEYARNSRGQIETITDQLGNQTFYQFDSKGNLEVLTDAEGNTVVYTYNAQGNAQTLKDQNGNVTTFAYDASGDMTKVTLPTLQVMDISRNGLGLPTRTSTVATGPAGPRLLEFDMIYDRNGQMTTYTNPDNFSVNFEYDADGNNDAIIDVLGRRTEFAYSAGGQRRLVRYPDLLTTQTAFNQRGMLETQISRQGVTQRFDYDDAGRPTGWSYENGGVPLAMPNSSFDIDGRASALNLPGGSPITIGYDGAGRVNRMEAAAGAEFRRSLTTYDVLGRIASIENARGNTTSNTYDGLGRVIRITYPDTLFEERTYDGNGNLIERTDRAGKKTVFEYDVLNRVTAVVDAGTNRTEYEYDEIGNLVLSRDAALRETRFEYNRRSLRTAIELPLGERSEFTYNDAGKLATVTNFNGEITSFDYDELNRLIVETHPDAAPTNYAYRPDGQLDSIDDARGLTTFTYDELGRIIGREEPDGEIIDYTYGVDGRLESILTNSGLVQRSFNAFGQLDSVQDLDGAITTYNYDESGNLVRTDLANGLVEHRIFDSLDRTTQIRYEDSLAVIVAQYDYEYDANGNIVLVGELGGRSVAYTYDDLHRLTVEQISQAGVVTRTVSYTYDKVWNRTQKNDSVAGITNYTYDNNDRITSEVGPIGTVNYTYEDNGGQLIRDDGATIETHTWDSRNRLTSSVLDDGVTPVQLFFEYDHAGNRMSKIVDGVETRYIIDANGPLAQVVREYTPVGAEVAAYAYGNRLLQQEQGGASSYYLQDMHSGVRHLADAAGTLTDSYTYDGFGIESSTTGSTANNYRYRGEQFDPQLGDYYLRARYYDQRSGRMLGRDPFAGNMRVPVSRNPYLYANSNPLMFSDPTGRFSLMSISLNLAIRVGITGLSISALQQATSFAMRSLSQAQDVTWKGPFLSGSLTHKPSAALPISIGGIDVLSVGQEFGIGFGWLTSDCTKRDYELPYQKADVNVLMLLGGVGAGTGAGVSLSMSSEWKSPSVLGTESYVFFGGASMFNIGIATPFPDGRGLTWGETIDFKNGPIGANFTGLLAGFSYGTTGGTIGLDASVDLMGGYSLGFLQGLKGCNPEVPVQPRDPPDFGDDF